MAPELTLPPLRHPVRRIGPRTFDFSRQIVVDIGGIPFSPDAAAVSVAEEVDRVLPVVEALGRAFDVVVLRRHRAAGGRRAKHHRRRRRDQRHQLPLRPGAGRGGGWLDRHAGDHAQSRRAWSAPARPQYADVVDDVRRRLVDRLELAVSLGVPEERIVLDPGHDLNKNTRHSLELTRRLAEIAALGLPLLAAVSNRTSSARPRGWTSRTGPRRLWPRRRPAPCRGRASCACTT